MNTDGTAYVNIATVKLLLAVKLPLNSQTLMKRTESTQRLRL